MAQLHPRGPLLSTPTVADVSGDCKNENSKDKKSKRVITPARKEQNRVAQRLYRKLRIARLKVYCREFHIVIKELTSKLGQRHKQHKTEEGQLSGTKGVYTGSKPRPIRPRSSKDAEASSRPSTSETAQPASISDMPDSKVRNDHSKIALPASDIGSTVTSPSYQPACTLERFIVDDVPAIHADGHHDSLDQINIPLDIGELLNCSLVSDADLMGSLDMNGMLAPYFSDHAGMDILQPSLSNRIMTENITLLNASMSGRSASEAHDDDNKDVVSFLQAGTKTMDSSYYLENGTYLADPYQNAMSFSQVTILNICAQNAKCLGMAPEDFISDNCLSLCSPFYRPASAADDPTALLAAVSRPYTPKFLQPTLSQILFPHHPIFDLIPIPAFRETAIMLASTSPSLLNSLELKQDIMCGGLVCWGTRHGSNHGGKGQPWDLRSWEAAPWFLKKWRLLVGGKDGDLWKQSMWWRNLRGEPMASD